VVSGTGLFALLAKMVFIVGAGQGRFTLHQVESILAVGIAIACPMRAGTNPVTVYLVFLVVS
jgi:hypothetical protein